MDFISGFSWSVNDFRENKSSRRSHFENQEQLLIALDPNKSNESYFLFMNIIAFSMFVSFSLLFV